MTGTVRKNRAVFGVCPFCAGDDERRERKKASAASLLPFCDVSTNCLRSASHYFTTYGVQYGTLNFCVQVISTVRIRLSAGKTTKPNLGALCELLLTSADKLAAPESKIRYCSIGSQLAARERQLRLDSSRWTKQSTS